MARPFWRAVLRLCRRTTERDRKLVARQVSQPKPFDVSDPSMEAIEVCPLFDGAPQRPAAVFLLQRVEFSA
jgi:hypothetical protein